MLHRGDSCSQAVKKIIAQYGIWQGRYLIQQRFQSCKAAYNFLHLNQSTPLSPSPTSPIETPEQRDENCNKLFDGCVLNIGMDTVFCCCIGAS